MDTIGIWQYLLKKNGKNAKFISKDKEINPSDVAGVLESDINAILSVMNELNEHSNSYQLLHSQVESFLNETQQLLQWFNKLESLCHEKSYECQTIGYWRQTQNIFGPGQKLSITT